MEELTRKVLIICGNKIEIVVSKYSNDDNELEICIGGVILNGVDLMSEINKLESKLCELSYDTEKLNEQLTEKKKEEDKPLMNLLLQLNSIEMSKIKDKKSNRIKENKNGWR